jgi:chromosomal replication initiation ATPase DnaA
LGTDYSTVIHACGKVKEKTIENTNFSNEISQLTDDVKIQITD